MSHDSPNAGEVPLGLIYRAAPFSGFGSTNINRGTPGGYGWMSKEVGDGDGGLSTHQKKD